MYNMAKKVAENKVIKPKEKIIKKPTAMELTIKAIDLIAEKGISMSKACEEVGINRRFFFEVIKSDVEISNNYARACEIRCDIMADEIIEITTNPLMITESKDGFDAIKGSWTENTHRDNIQRAKLQADARIWLLSKMMPKKYGNQKVDDSKDQRDLSTITIEVVNPTIDIDEL